MFSQGVVVLCDAVPSLDDLAAAFADESPRVLPAGVQRWMGGSARLAFDRLRITYVAGPDDLVLPPGYDPVAELRWLTPRWRRLLDVPAVLCAFNPNGEVLVDAAAFDDALDFARRGDLEPLDLWSNVRMFRYDETWMVMDTVGLAQLDVADHEAVFPGDRYDPGDVARMLRNLSWYTASTRATIEPGDTTDGPGGRWQGFHADDGVISPPRPTIRWFPLDGTRAPDALVPASVDEPSAPPPAAGPPGASGRRLFGRKGPRSR